MLRHLGTDTKQIHLLLKTNTKSRPDLRLPFQRSPVPNLCYLMTVAAQDINTEAQGLNAIITLTELGITLHYITLH